MEKILEVGLVVGVIFLFTACQSANKSVDSSPVPSSSQVDEDVQKETVVIQNSQFSPSSIKVSVGTKVTWQNQDNYAHKIIINGGPGVPLPASQSWTKTWQTAGTYVVGCGIHPEMKVTVVVK